MKNYLAKHRLFLFILPVLLVVLLVCQNNLWSKESSFKNDIDQYYSYLPSIFIYQSKDLSYPDASRYWAKKTENGALVPKTSIGMAYTYLPFFLPAFAYQSVFGDSNTGYEMPYEIAAKIWGIVLSLLCIYLLYLLAGLYFKKSIALGSACLLFFGTNTLVYALETGLMSHLALLILFSTVIYLSHLLKQKSSHKQLLLLCFCISFIAIIRPTDVLVALYPLWYFISHTKFRNNVLASLKKPLLLGLIVLAFIAPILPQLLYWKISSGQWIVYSYGDERFFFDRPKIIEFLFGYRKGWFVYTPLAAMSLICLFLFRKSHKSATPAVIGILLIAVYVYASWWAWWYGGSFGSRTMVQYLAFLLLPLAAMLSYLKQSKKYFIKWPSLALLAFILALNLVQINQFKKAIIHWDGMTKEAYWAVFMGKDKPFDYYGMIQVPDYEGRKYTGEEYDNLLHKKITNIEFDDFYGASVQFETSKPIYYVQLKIYTSSIVESAVVVFSTNDNNGNDLYFAKAELNKGTGKNNVTFTLLESYLGAEQTKNTTLKAYIYNPDNEKIKIKSLEFTAY